MTFPSEPRDVRPSAAEAADEAAFAALDSYEECSHPQARHVKCGPGPWDYRCGICGVDL